MKALFCILYLQNKAEKKRDFEKEWITPQKINSNDSIKINNQSFKIEKHVNYK